MARLQLRYESHLQDLSFDKWAEQLNCFSFNFVNDPFSEYVAHHDPGRPHLRWDDHL